ncbi:MAG: trypsin-like peptidase domain-containing protein [Spirochaetes bacterium]|nr:trypsin-like peptidase domain-containing protein [Spirochaetota bacterium]
MKTRRVFFSLAVPVVAAFISLSLIPHASCTKNGGDLFGSQEKSPLHDATTGDAARVQESFRKVFELNRNRVVYISTEQTVKMPRNPFFNDPFFREFFGMPNSGQPGTRTQKRTGLGTGFILSSDGYICTNHHVVASVDSVKVKVGSDTYDAQIVGSDERTDLALLKIKPGGKLDPVYLGDSNSVQVGDWAIAIGNPFGLDSTFTVGVVSALGRRDLDLMGGSQSHIQTDASINPGNSGGPLLNIQGEVIGINRMIYSGTGGNIGIGFAIPINTAKAVLDELRLHKKIKRGFIGVQIVPLTEEYATQLGLKDVSGALVGQVVPGGPALKGGMRVGDVILSIEGKKIEDFGDLVEIVEKTPIGKTLKIGVWREKTMVNLFVTVAERP